MEIMVVLITLDFTLVISEYIYINIDYNKYSKKSLLVTKDITLSKNISADPNFSFWTYEDLYLTNKAKGEVLTQTDGGIQIMPKETASKEPSQQWIFDINSKIPNTKVLAKK